jgi:hypothetical protein
MLRRELDTDDVFVIDDFFTVSECAAAITHGEALGFEEASVNTIGGSRMRKDIRDNSRAMFDDHSIAAHFFERARPFLPEVLRRNWRIVGFNERWRYYRYDVGERFKPHYDGSVRRSEVERTFLTFMVYLNDDFLGGETKFYFLREDPYLEVRPVTGQALVFAHERLHEGAELLRGRKYVLRTDVFYRLDEAAHA